LESFLFDWGTDAAPRLSVIPKAKVMSPSDQVEALFREGWDSRALVLVDKEPEAAGEPGPALSPSATFVSDSANRVVVRADAGPDGGYLLLLDTHSADWRATVDGGAADILLANGLFRAVRLVPGRHVVEFVYRPAAFLLGASLSAIFFAVVLGLLAVQHGGPADTAVTGGRGHG
jgi:hypothetical protein